jgi:antitoxin ParD1/3/4
MSNIAKRTFSLPVQHAKFIDRKVRSGAFASASEVVRAGIRALQERDQAVERWLREEVAPAYDAMKARPSRGIPAAKVFATIRTRHGKRVKAAQRAKA